MKTEEFGAEIVSFWSHWKSFPSFSDLSKKSKNEIDSIIKLIEKFAKKQNEQPSDRETLKFFVSHLIKLAEWISFEKWNNKKASPDIYMKCDNFFHKVRISLESIKAYGLMLEFNIENNLQNRSNLDLDFLKEIDKQLQIYERKLLKK